MGVLKFLSGLPGIKIHDQLLAVLLAHIHDGMDVTHGAKYRIVARLWMLGDDRVRFRFIGLFGKQNLHAAIIALVFLTVGSLWTVGCCC